MCLRINRYVFAACLTSIAFLPLEADAQFVTPPSPDSSTQADGTATAGDEEKEVSRSKVANPFDDEARKKRRRASGEMMMEGMEMGMGMGMDSMGGADEDSEGMMGMMGMGGMGDMAEMSGMEEMSDMMGGMMGGMMGAPSRDNAERVFQRGLQRAIIALGKAKTDRERETLRGYVRQALDERYRKMISARQKELDRLSASVARLKADLKRREHAKDRVIEVQMQSVQLAAEGLLQLGELSGARNDAGGGMGGGYGSEGFDAGGYGGGGGMGGDDYDGGYGDEMDDYGGDGSTR